VRIALLLVGYGNVARRFVELLGESAGALAGLGIEPVVVGAVTRRRGAIFDVTGLGTAALAAPWPPDAAGRPASTVAFVGEALEGLRTAAFDRVVVVETTVLDIKAGEPAISHVRAALAGGADVVSANKGPIAFAHRALADEAARAGRAFLFEGAVMDGIPIFNMVRETMPAVTVNGFRGVVNSTTNYMLTAMERGEAFAQALRRMQELGVAEADPSHDVDGWDAAAKAAALANVLLDADTNPHAVEREGIDAGTGPRAIEARRRGKVLKLVASGTGRGRAARLAVRLEELAPDDPLAVLDGQGNALELDTWPLGRVVITQRDGGLEQTAYALVTDMVAVARRGRG
jgi:homoserine dehydrogenase